MTQNMLVAIHGRPQLTGRAQQLCCSVSNAYGLPQTVKFRGQSGQVVTFLHHAPLRLLDGVSVKWRYSIGTPLIVIVLRMGREGEGGGAIGGQLRGNIAKLE